MSLETRTFAGHLEVRADGDGRTVAGLAAPFHTPTPIGSRFTETFVPGSFDLGSEAPLHGGHTSELPVSPPGRLWEGRDGLYGEWRVSHTTAGDDLLTLIRDGAVRGLSVGFVADDTADQWGTDSRGRAAVTRYRAKLLHVAAVPRAAYPDAKVLAIRDASEPYGDVDYADPGYQADGKKRYPIDTAEHVHAAWAYINREHNAAQYTPEQLARVKARIKAAAQRFGIQIGGQKASPRHAQRLLQVRAREYEAQDAEYRSWAGVYDPAEAQRFLLGRI